MGRTGGSAQNDRRSAARAGRRAAAPSGGAACLGRAWRAATTAAGSIAVGPVSSVHSSR